MPIMMTPAEAAALLPLLDGKPEFEALRTRLLSFNERERPIPKPESGDYLSKHFLRSEFACKCGCGKGDISPKLLQVLEELRAATGGPLSIMSGYRCETHNRRVGGAKNSQHCKGNAADIKSKSHSPREIARMAERILGKTGGIGVYPTFTHVDVRNGGPARW